MAFEQLGAVTISIDLTACGQRPAPRHEEAVFTRLLELFDLYEIAATWAIARPAESEFVGPIAAAEVPHEFALLGDASWVGEEAGRAAFARELHGRLAAAREAGLTLDALASPEAVVPREHYDLLVKHGVTVVRQPRPGRAFGERQPRPLRHGVWESPATCPSPQPARLLGGAARRTVRQASAARGVGHAVIDLAAAVAGDRRLHAVESLLRQAARRAARGAVRIATLRTLTAEWSRPVAAQPARSILRAA